MGFDVGSTGLRIVLDAEVPVVIGRYVGEDVDLFLADHGLTRADIGWWVCHPGGPKVIDALQETLGLTDEAIALTRRSLAQIGNLSSASVLHVLEDTLRERPPAPGSHGLLMAMGPGFCSELVLLRAALSDLADGVHGPRRSWSASSGWPSSSSPSGTPRGRSSAGGVETGFSHYPPMVLLHTGLLVGALVEAYVREPHVPSALAWSMLVVVVLSQALRWWCITTLGRQWNTRVIVVPGMAPVQKGPYRIHLAPQLRRRRARGHRAAAGARRAGSPRSSSRCSTRCCSPCGSGWRTPPWQRSRRPSSA